MTGVIIKKGKLAHRDRPMRKKDVHRWSFRVKIKTEMRVMLL